MSFLNLSYQNIHFLHPSSSSTPITLPPLPPSITHSYIPTPQGDLEILHSSPLATQKSQPALFFIHGGMGSASVWIEYLSFFSSHALETACYAVSMRGHGGSWYPSYLRMVYGTTKGDLAGDVVEGIKWAVGRERERLGLEGREEDVEVVLVGHSSGGGLVQFILSEGLLVGVGVGVRVKGLVLMGAVPGFGSLGVYLNWFSLDPLFTIRLLLHAWHPNSPLSTPPLVRRVFFSEQLPESYLLRFMSFMNRYESFLWPLGMGWRFVDPERILLAISGWGDDTSRQGQGRVLVIAGEEDKIMTQDIMQRLANWYRGAYKRLVEGEKIDGVVNDAEDGTEGQEDGMGVRYAVVPGAGHHCQNDVDWEVGANKVMGFYQGLL
ncbi:Alpha/Beta hydrolase protein [Sordaria brevicollis]|uniref:Alpha/Beta hydrolase protein n=1 Tax=Sordaria brevicollis TaxID=83679 RepID=A0AAE0P330_SORBR|nr:Alpha/Beta hydrolase protein [Sordaria brevicollis]